MPQARNVNRTVVLSPPELVNCDPSIDLSSFLETSVDGRLEAGYSFQSRQ
jgi:hypothetical protein